jgi:hypothetical protein
VQDFEESVLKPSCYKICVLFFNKNSVTEVRHLYRGTSMQLSVHRHLYSGTPMQLSVHRHLYSGTPIQLSIHRHLYSGTPMQLSVHRHLSSYPHFNFFFHVMFIAVSPVLVLCVLNLFYLGRELCFSLLLCNQ